MTRSKTCTKTPVILFGLALFFAGLLCPSPAGAIAGAPVPGTISAYVTITDPLEAQNDDCRLSYAALTTACRLHEPDHPIGE